MLRGLDALSEWVGGRVDARQPLPDASGLFAFVAVTRWLIRSRWASVRLPPGKFLCF